MNTDSFNGRIACLVALLVGPLSLPLIWAQASPHANGVFVEQVEKDSESERAGLRAGDVILAWSRSDMHGVIESPFDLIEVEIEQNPRGSVMLEGLRGSQKQIWNLGSNVWGIVTRPVLVDDVLPLYERALQLSRRGALADAARRLEAAGHVVNGSEPAWLRPWLLSRAGEFWATMGRWDESDARYTQAIGSASSAGSALVAAQILLKWGDQLRGRSEWPKAEECYRRSIAEAQRVATESLLIAAALNSLGHVEWGRGKLSEAEARYREALNIRQKLAPGSLDVARSQNNLGLIAWKQGKLDEAEEYHRTALSVRERLAPDSIDVAASLGNLASVALDRGDLENAKRSGMEALTIQERLVPGSLTVATSFNNLGIVSYYLGDFAAAEGYYDRALQIQRKTAGGSAEVARTLNNLGDVFSDRGDLDKAEEYFLEALTIHKKVAHGGLEVAGAYINLSNIAAARGELRAADEYLRRALTIQEKIALGTIDHAKTLNNLGNNALDREELVKADGYFHRSLSIIQKVAPSSLDFAAGLNSLAGVSLKRKDLSNAEMFVQQALALQRKLAPGSLDEATSLDSLTEIAMEAGDLAKAEKYGREALVIQENLAPQSAREARASYTLASVLVRQGHTDEALVLFERALTSLEAQTGRLGGTEDTRSNFRAQYGRYYHDYARVLVEQRQAEQAFHVLERSRTRSLLAMLAERDLVFASDVPPAIRNERAINAAAHDRIYAQLIQLAREDPSRNSTKIQALRDQLHHLELERGQITERIKRDSSARFVALQYPQPVDAEQARAALDNGTVLFSYSVGEKDTLLFILQGGGPEAVVEAHSIPIGEGILRRRIEKFRRVIQEYPRLTDQNRAGNAVAVQQRGRGLYELLVRPGERHLATCKRLLVAPDGPMYTLPFSALVRHNNEYLIQAKPLHTINSATLYVEIKNERNQNRRAPITLVAFGDPMYSRSPRTPSAAAKRRGATVNYDFPPLPFTREEVEGIAKLFPSLQKQVYLGADATEARAKTTMSKARYVHFAVHGFVEEVLPLNSGLALSIPVRPRHGENGILQAWEIFEQGSMVADLVVLSACQTGLGKELRGEGLIGLTRAFQYAGARSIIASLWGVDDFQTAALMRSFYMAVQRGKTKDEALQIAQLDLLKTRSAAHPYFWASFTLSGDWK